MNVGNGVDSTFNPNVAPHPSDCPYMLCVGNRKGHKNEHRIVQAFVNARLPLCLLMTGDPTPSLLAQLNSISATSRVRFTGRVTDSQLASLYRGAIALVFPSLYEGFGLPVLEAMACGTPVITSNITALPEIAGDAALLVDPNSTDEITRAIVRIFDDHLLRTTLRERGLRRASLFNWATTILGVHKVLTALQA
jgi:glycosyltransferase involved in cell wall biosynthesis